MLNALPQIVCFRALRSVTGQLACVLLTLGVGVPFYRPSSSSAGKTLAMIMTGRTM